MSKYRKKPVEVEAWQVGSDEPWPDWMEEAVYVKQTVEIRNNRWIVHTLEGDHLARKHDYIIRGVKGELYPCKPDIFAMTYEAVGAETNYEHYFGSPERVAENIERLGYDQCEFCAVLDDECELLPKCSMTFREWLKERYQDEQRA